MKKIYLVSFILGFLFWGDLHGQTTGTGSPGLRIDVTGSNEEGDFGVANYLVPRLSADEKNAPDGV